MNSIKVVILSSSYPPDNKTSANRPKAWVNYLPKASFYPVVITWDYSSKSKEVRIEKNKGHEVHYVPYIPNLFVRSLNRFLFNRILKIPFLTTQLFLRYIHPYFTNTTALKRCFVSYVKNEKPEIVISSGGPFTVHQIGAKYRDRLGYKFIADYRDPWSNNKLLYKDRWFFRILAALDKVIEKRTAEKYDHLIAVSEFQRAEIVEHLGFDSRHSSTMYNGFEGKSKEHNSALHQPFTILFSGEFYKTQPLEDILDAICSLFKERVLDATTRVIFLGSAKNPITKRRIDQSIKGFEKYFDITERIPHAQAMAIQRKAHLLVMPTYMGIKGIPSSKLFDYINTQNPILAYPNDNDIIEEILTDTNLGIICDTLAEIRTAIGDTYQRFSERKPLAIPNVVNINKYSREEQTNVLISVLNELVGQQAR